MIFVAPHGQLFIGDQLRAVKKRVVKASLLIPSPYFSSLALGLPFLSRRFASLRRAEESSKEFPKEDLLRPRYFDLPGGFTRGVTDSLAARSSTRAVSAKRTDFDVIHSHFLGLNGFIGMRLKEKFGKPLVVTVYGGDAYSVPFLDAYRKRLAEEVVRSADRLIAVSRSLEQNLRTLGADQSKIRIIPTGFDASLFAPIARERARSLLGLPADKRVLLTVANLVPQKGHEYLLESLRDLSRTRGDLMLVVVGGGALEKRLVSKAGELGLSGIVRFAKARPHAEIPTWLSACDVFVLPSVSEGSPAVLTEAMACGKPIVATRVGGLPDMVEEGVEGYLVPPVDAAALGTAITRALSREWDAEKITKHAQSYSWDALASRIADVYAEVSPATNAV